MAVFLLQSILQLCLLLGEDLHLGFEPQNILGGRTVESLLAL
jgi:hypothetical protein